MDHVLARVVAAPDAALSFASYPHIGRSARSGMSGRLVSLPVLGVLLMVQQFIVPFIVPWQVASADSGWSWALLSRPTP
jgi:hypothetical protein